MVPCLLAKMTFWIFAFSEFVLSHLRQTAGDQQQKRTRDRFGDGRQKLAFCKFLLLVPCLFAKMTFWIFALYGFLAPVPGLVPGPLLLLVPCRLAKMTFWIFAFSELVLCFCSWSPAVLRRWFCGSLHFISFCSWSFAFLWTLLCGCLHFMSFCSLSPAVLRRSLFYDLFY